MVESPGRGVPLLQPYFLNEMESGPGIASVESGQGIASVESGPGIASLESGPVLDVERQNDLNLQGVGSRHAKNDNTERSGSLRTQESFNSRRHSISGRRSSGSWRRSSQVSDDVQCEIEAKSGDIGDWVVTEETQDAVDISVLQPEKDVQIQVPKLLLYTSSVAHLSVFGIFGVFARYLLQKLFGPNIADVTSDQSSLYLDLPSNMVGSFLMGWFGVVFKGAITQSSESLAIGLTTGFLGSLTTFSGWNQKMLDLTVDDRWPAAAFGILAGMMLAVSSIYFGVGIAEGLRELLTQRGEIKIKWRVESRRSHAIVLTIMLLVWGTLWGVSGGLLRSQLKHNHSISQLWLACLVGPVGVWIRWRLARLNGKGLGRKHSFKWVPFGTLIANILAACIMAGLATTKKAVGTKRCNVIVNGLQFGLLGCLSTVSTFVAEFYAMCQSNHWWRAVMYAILTIVPSYALGTLFYSVPVWVKGYK